ncbi:hypothetical protein HQQ92_19130 [Shewanella sp. DC2-4]|uniref:SH3 domain-containing protein n=1 Tax=Shewanella sp. DC2-4 TaxID=2739431 RepID=UPI001563C719|nr:SH3 domain-containing protein [Shewanella sp. DC2-4]NRD33843.1 hypothetical protein [Shewanella sp. DC2-4]
MTINKVMTKGFDNPLAKFDKANAKLARFYSTQNRIREIQKAFELPNAISQMLKDIDNLTPPIKALQPTLCLATAGTAFTQSQSPSFLARMLAPQKALLGDMAKLHPQLSPLLTQLSSTTTGVFISKFLTDNLDLIILKLPALKSEHLALLEEAAQNFSDIPPLTESSLSELSQALEAAQNDALTDDDFWRNLLDQIKSNPILLWIINIIVIPMIINLVSAQMNATEPVQVHLENTFYITLQTVEEVKETANKEQCQEVLQVCRFVGNDKLNVRSDDNGKSLIIDTIPFGLAVYVIDRNDARTWTYIQYYDQETEGYKFGWVATRHLKSYK